MRATTAALLQCTPAAIREEAQQRASGCARHGSIRIARECNRHDIQQQIPAHDMGRQLNGSLGKDVGCTNIPRFGVMLYSTRAPGSTQDTHVHGLNLVSAPACIKSFNGSNLAPHDRCCMMILHWPPPSPTTNRCTLALRIIRGHGGSAALIDNAAYRICRNHLRT